MIYLLDTSAISALMREDPRILSWLASLESDDRLVTCTIVRGEILFGLERLSEGQRRTVLEAKAHNVFASMLCESVLAVAAERYATLKVTQQRLGLSLDENDLWIASTAFVIGATLVSSDRDFQRVEALPVLAL